MPPDEANPADDAKRKLNTPVEFVRGVGPERAKLLVRLGLPTAASLLFHFPHRYEDLTNECLIENLQEDELQSVRGTIAEARTSSSGFGKSRFAVLLTDGQGGSLRATWFNQPFMAKRLTQGQHVVLTAKPRMKGLIWQMSHPQVTYLEEEEAALETPMLPVYSTTEGLSQYYLRKIIQEAVEDYAELLPEVFPASLLTQYDLMPLVDAVRAIHHPENQEQAERAQRRFVFQELFVLQLALSVRRREQHDLDAVPLPTTTQIDARIRRLLPFELTESQDKAIAEVTADLALDRPMNRLLQGEVGSGKTMVALYAMLVCLAHGQQAALMAPTEILARQHIATLSKLLDASRVRYELLSGSLSKKERSELLGRILSGEVDVVIGTQAIIQEGVRFKNLGLVVVDEQHKFGVKQRAALRQDDQSPHYLVMTATPIPRTVTMTMFGDLDISTLRELPAGRQPVSTYLVEEGMEERWWGFVRDRLREGRQAFVVAPLVEESETIDAPSVAQAFEQLTNGELEAFRVGLLHGRMPADEKQAIMDEFNSGKTQVLVSTTVVEVGVDVPNATIMTIAGAERFGLAQLHQLRGRIGRGTHPGFCGLLMAGISEADSTDKRRERLEKFKESTDGFELAEVDFQIRGPGDLFGTRQHGLPPLRIADLNRDRETLQEARREAQLLEASDPALQHANHAGLREQMLRRYGEALNLGDVG
ncbi:ATP-dependent DNA helicase RecG [Adhaeretor mobilis]|uniref:ATP-dependent DNA helicase RecG n=1 Tax=Adhaeretor mobilis TaxID=1930276 RepID=A0A517MZN8_9BACT|nr:ATP-dependent DNA helicase RecG [Adhaeretor mobilis]QDT00335.1 ATP-dependent DNA helicase RecG [Adhaeretor mobilis]